MHPYTLMDQAWSFLHMALHHMVLQPLRSCLKGGSQVSGIYGFHAMPMLNKVTNLASLTIG